MALSTRTPLSQIQMPAPKARISSVRSCTRAVQPACASAVPMTSPVNPPPAISTCRVMVVSSASLVVSPLPLPNYTRTHSSRCWV